MKILFVDTSIDGHHAEYLKHLSLSVDVRPGVVIPEKLEEVNADQFVVNYDIKSLKGYLRWIAAIREIQRKGSYDVVHFVYGDVFYRFFGIGLSKFKKAKIIVTFHQFRYGWLHQFSLKRTFNRISIGIVHTQHLLTYLNDINVTNAKKIEYPVFEKYVDQDEAEKRKMRRSLDISDNQPTLLALGGTRYDKGLDILLEALADLKVDFKLIIAGKEETFLKKDIRNLSASYHDKISLDLRYLSEQDITNYINVADIVVLPYRKVFDGASGPLGIGTLYQRCIIGPSHGSLGQIIASYHLGFTFESENIDSLRLAVSKAVNCQFKPDQKYQQYRTDILPETFVRRYRTLFDSIEANWT